MNELEFRRRIWSDPHDMDDSLYNALQSKEAYRTLKKEALNVDGKIKTAFNVPVPDDLADRIIFQTQVQHSHNVIRPSFTKRALSMAASVAFVAGLLAGQINWGNVVVPHAEANLATAAVHYVQNEAEFIRTMNEDVTVKQVNAKLLPFEKQFSDKFPYHIYYMNHCNFGNSNALHMVVEGKMGRVTVLLTGGESSQVGEFIQKGMKGTVIDLGDHSLILVGDMQESIDEMKNKLMTSLI
ncbi:DUF3379 domain-containing protein [Vibrio sp.]|nr:DUF3379 domain-containing protein [Vibrio sp.]